MENPSGSERTDAPQPSQMIPTGSAPLDEERRRLLQPQWEGMYRSMRRMDGIELGETEPATTFAWEDPQP